MWSGGVSNPHYWRQCQLFLLPINRPTYLYYMRSRTVITTTPHYFNEAAVKAAFVFYNIKMGIWFQLRDIKINYLFYSGVKLLFDVFVI